MYYSIPSVAQVNDEDGSTYSTYEVHLNGVLHCAVRYSQLHKLNELLSKQFDVSQLFPFPPKKLFSLSNAEKEERREMLELFIQSISQSPEMSRCEVFMSFLIQAQKDTCHAKSGIVPFLILLADHSHMTIQIDRIEHTPEVLKAVAKELNIDEAYQAFFNLYLMKGVGKNKEIVRKMQDVECPYLSLDGLCDEEYSVELRRSYWDNELDKELMSNSVTLHLLYIECIRNMEDRWITPAPNVLQNLKQLKRGGFKEQFIKVVQEQEMYGFQYLGNGKVNYPETEQEVRVYGGAEQLRLVYPAGRVLSFPITRIKCWKLFHDKLPVLSFEYLVAKDELKWVDINTDNTIVILISMVLQSMLDELILKRAGKSLTITKVRTNSGFLPCSNSDRKTQKEKVDAPTLSSLRQSENELFMSGIGDDDL